VKTSVGMERHGRLPSPAIELIILAF
jgi:hypothetical protein